MQEPGVSLRQLPSVEAVAGDPRLAGLGLAPTYLRRAVRRLIADERRRILAGGARTDAVADGIIADLISTFGRDDPRVINATGILIHTNLGRGAVSRAAATAMATAASSWVALEVDPASGRRGDRQRRVGRLLQALTGCEAALVVNNNAAALLLVVATMASGKDAIVSRGEAVEIGGGFRLPDVLRQGGARLVEVGTTNRTYARDYDEACSDATGMLLKVSSGNFVMTGYTHATTVPELAGIGARHSVPVVEDQGDGLLDRLDVAGLDPGRSLTDSLAEGADVVTASGDKLLGGPQCGLILGRADLVGQIARQPLARALRVDKVTLAGLEATLQHYLRGEAQRDIPLWRMAATPTEELRERAKRIVTRLGDRSHCDVVASTASFGGGALPGQSLPGWSVRVRPVGGESVDRLAAQLRQGTPGLWGRIEQGRVLLDLRTVLPEDDETIIRTLAAGMD